MEIVKVKPITMGKPNVWPFNIHQVSESMRQARADLDVLAEKLNEVIDNQNKIIDKLEEKSNDN